MKRIILALILGVVAGNSFAGFEPQPYSKRILAIVAPSKIFSKDYVYASLAFKRPGLFSFKEGMTAADIIRKAGGASPRMTAYHKPSHVLVFRPTKSDPDPAGAFYEFPLRRGEKRFKMEECSFVLQPGDLIEIAFYGVKR